VLVEPSVRAYVDSATPNTGHLNPAGDLPVGRTAASVRRAFVTFDLTPFHGRTIGTVTLTGPETEATDCDHRSIEAWTTSPVNRRSTWRHQPAWRAKLATAGPVPDPTCPFPRLVWLVSEAVQEAVAAGQPTITLGLRNTDEQNPAFGRRLGHLTLQIWSEAPPAGRVLPGSLSATQAGSSGAP
jgi:hypothetical protein